MDVAHDFYEHKDEERLLKEAAAAGVSVVVKETTDVSKTYVVGDTWTAIVYRKPGKPVAVTLRPILKA